MLLNQLIKHTVERKLTSDRVFNMGETKFEQSTKSSKVIAVRGSKNVWTKCEHGFPFDHHGVRQ